MKRLATSSVSAIALFALLEFTRAWSRGSSNGTGPDQRPRQVGLRRRQPDPDPDRRLPEQISTRPPGRIRRGVHGQTREPHNDRSSPDQYPAPPNVNLALMLRNVGSETFSFTEPGPQSPLDIVLGGTGAISYRQPPPDNAQAAPGLAPLLLGVRNTFIRPNETVRIPIRWLKCLPGGAPSYWTMPGEYTLRIRFTTGLDDIYGRIKWRGVAIESDPINLTVAAPREAWRPQFGVGGEPGLSATAAGLTDVDPRNLEGNCQSTATAARRRECPLQRTESSREPTGSLRFSSTSTGS